MIRQRVIEGVKAAWARVETKGRSPANHDGGEDTVRAVPDGGSDTVDPVGVP